MKLIEPYMKHSMKIYAVEDVIRESVPVPTDGCNNKLKFWKGICSWKVI